MLAVAWWLLRSMAPSTRTRPQIGRDRTRGRFGGRSSTVADPQDDLIACSRCGVYLPRTRATMREGDLYCSPKCRDSAPDPRSVTPEDRQEQPR